MVSSAKISVTMWDTGNIKQWQFIQEDQNYYVLILNASDIVDEELIVGGFKNVLGEEGNIIVEYVNEIPVQASNKRRAVICNYKKE